MNSDGFSSMVQVIDINTPDGPITCCFHPAEPGSKGILWVFGAGGGLGGPAGGLYIRKAEQWAARGVASLRLDYRRPGRLRDCVNDVRKGLEFLAQKNCSQVILVGHSFGGAVVIQAAVDHPQVIAVAALSSQTHGAENVDRLSPRPLLLMHGTEDEILPDSCSRSLYAQAKEPKTLHLYPACRHGLDECREALDRDLDTWLGLQLLPAQEKASFRPDARLDPEEPRLI